jgi:hypothetical protein
MGKTWSGVGGNPTRRESALSRRYFHNVLGLGALLALGDFKFNRVTFLEGLITLALNGGKMNKDIRAAILADESIALGIAEPFYFSSDTFQLFFLLAFKKRCGFNHRQRKVLEAR